MHHLHVYFASTAVALMVSQFANIPLHPAESENSQNMYLSKQYILKSLNQTTNGMLRLLIIIWTGATSMFKYRMMNAVCSTCPVTYIHHMQDYVPAGVPVCRRNTFHIRYNFGYWESNFSHLAKMNFLEGKSVVTIF